MQRISSTSPHKIQPHQKETLNHKQKLLAKRAAAKVVRRKINESQQLSRSNINTTQSNQVSNQTQNQDGQIGSQGTLQARPATSQPVTGYSLGTGTQHSKAMSSISNQAQSPTLITSYNQTASRISSQQPSVTQSINGTAFAAQKQASVNHSPQMNQQHSYKPVNYVASTQQTKKGANLKQEEEKSVSMPPQVSQQPFKPVQAHDNYPLNRQKPASAQLKPQQPSVVNHSHDQQAQRGEQQISKRHQMRMTTGERDTPHNVTRSLIEDGSEDFTNIEEKLQEDTRISIRNAVKSSLNNVSLMVKQAQQQQRQQMSQQARNSVRNRRGTTQSNDNCTGPSNQPSKEETFETSSFFDEGVASKQLLGNRQKGPHRCNQMEGYNIPTIFNTLMFGIDQNKVSENIRESFSSISHRGRPSSQLAQQQKQASQQQSNHQLLKNQNANKLSQLVTKVDKPPIIVFDNQNVRNQEMIKSSSNHQKHQRSSSKSPKCTGRQSQLSLMAAQNQVQEHVESLSSENVNQHKNYEEELKYSVHELHSESEIEDLNNNGDIANPIEDFQSSELHRNHLIQTLQSLQYIKTLPPVNKAELRKRQVALPPPKHAFIKKTIIFDLDETLVHCIDDVENTPCDQPIRVTFPNGETVEAGINVRPYALECLKKANEHYQVVVFTASHKAYADVVLDTLDPRRELIQYRLYRDHCIRTEEGIYIKDLRIITNRQLKDLIIVDNAVYSFGYQLDNGIPIIPFYDDKTDEELMHLIFYINCLANCHDVRDQNRKAFQLKDLQEIDIQEYLQSMMNNHAQDGDNDQ